MTTVAELLVSGIPQVVRNSKRIRAITDQMSVMGVAECMDRRGELIERLYTASSQRKIAVKIGDVSRERVERWVDRGIEAAERKFGSGKRINRDLFHRRRMFCQSCEHYKLSCEKKGWKSGCDLLEKPCSVELRWMSDDENWCPIHCGRTKPTSPEQTVTEFVAVTSLSLLPHHLSRQSKCLDSWKAFGLDVVAVNTVSEVVKLREIYPQVDQWVEEDSVCVEFTRPTQFIHRLASVSCDINRPVLIINSDIELYGDKSTIVDRMKDKSLVVGIRWNYPHGDYALARREQHGLDAFLLTPDMTKTLPKLHFAIGRPVWDYWLPEHFRRLDYSMSFIGQPLLYHQSHPILWTKDDWHIAAKWFTEEYASEIQYDSLTFRSSLPFPPDSKAG